MAGQARAWASWSRSGILLVPLAICVLLVGCAGAGAASDSSHPLLVLARPAFLAPYSIFVSDLATGDLDELGATTLHVSQSIHGLGLSADGHTLYVSDISGDELVGYSLVNGRPGARHAVRVGDQPVHMVNTLDGRTIFVTNFQAQSVSVVDATHWKHEKDIAVPANPHGIVLSPDGRWAYVACYGAAAIAVIDTATATLAATIPMPQLSQPYGIAISSDGRYVYASDNLRGRLLVVSTATHALVGTVTIGVKPALIARSPDGRTLYVANGASHSVSVVDIGADPAHPTVRATVVVTGYPHGLAVTPDGRYVVVADTFGHEISVIDTRTNTVAATIQAENEPNDVLILG
jgi:YVTN family beta-propeller protein